ncbi:MAG: DUF362 domain-containing protein [Spirochaetes bacterium]|nr:DUF362 domain-containing protein [Spirochaetota bacterium]
MPADILFARWAAATMEQKNSIGAKWDRLLERLDIPSAVRNRRTAIKVHLGGGFGFTTVHPFFVRRLVSAVKAAGASDVFVTDIASDVASAVERGYTAEVLGCRIVPCAGEKEDRVVPKPIDPPYRALSEVRLASEIVEAEALVDLSHVKGHGACAFGGASKNLSMGCVDQWTRRALHGIEGGLAWDRDACTHCKTCAEHCPNSAISFAKNGTFEVFYHNCKLCQHCVLICPEHAISVVGGGYRFFQRGMALSAGEVLKTFARDAVRFISVLSSVTIFCDCWGLSTPSLVPDIGILAGRDIVAIEQATLDLIRTEDLIPGSLPPGWELGPTGHLFERIHRKDPYAVVEELAALGWGTREYSLVEVE